MTGRPLVLVVGTGTEVGKTFVSCGLLRHRRGRLAALKPVESGVGVEGPADAKAHAEASGLPIIRPCYGFSRPVSPHRAAAEEGAVIDVDALADWATGQALPEELEAILVEGAGGVFSPLSWSADILDFADALVDRGADVRVLLVAPNRLGVLHDVRATTMSLEERCWSPRVLALSGRGNDASVDSNAADLRVFLDCPVVEVPAGAEPDDPCWARLWAELRRDVP